MHLSWLHYYLSEGEEILRKTSFLIASTPMQPEGSAVGVWETAN